jgi:biotin carboxylase
MGARGVRRVDDAGALEEAVRDAVTFSRSGKAILEELIEGPEFSIDALLVNGEMHVCGIADRHIAFEPYFIEVGHTMPTVRSEADQEEITRVLHDAARALGIDNGAAKGDIFLTERGAVVGEVAARLSGGYMSGWTYPYASGVPVTEAAMRLALGMDPGDLTPRSRWTSAERASVSIPGRVTAVDGVEEARLTVGVREVFQRAYSGDAVVFPRNNTEKCANVISAAPSRQEAVQAAEQAISRLVFRLEAGRTETIRFLADPSPPFAFEPADLRNRAALADMPSGTRDGGITYYRPLPALERETGRDWNYRSLPETVDALARFFGIMPAEEGPAHGVEFWSCILKGGLQGGLFYLDTLNRDPSLLGALFER